MRPISSKIGLLIHDHKIQKNRFRGFSEHTIRSEFFQLLSAQNVSSKHFRNSLTLILFFCHLLFDYEVVIFLQVHYHRNYDFCMEPKFLEIFVARDSVMQGVIYKSERSDVYFNPRKFYVRRNNNNIDSIETGRIVIAHLLP